MITGNSHRNIKSLHYMDLEFSNQLPKSISFESGGKGWDYIRE